MIWLYIFLGLIGLALLLFFLLRFDYSLSFQFPGNLQGTFRFSFLGFKRAGEFSTARKQPESTSVAQSTSFPDTPIIAPSGQAGFLRLPSLRTLRNRLKRGAFKFAVNFQVWAALIRFGTRSLGFFGHAVRTRLRFLSLGTEDPVVLGYLAGGYSALSGFFPGLRCPVHYYFNENRFTFGLKVRGRFNGLHLVAAVVRSFLAFPWFFLTARFIGSIRDDSLNWWQENLLNKLAPRYG